MTSIKVRKNIESKLTTCKGCISGQWHWWIRMWHFCNTKWWPFPKLVTFWITIRTHASCEYMEMWDKPCTFNHGGMFMYVVTGFKPDQFFIGANIFSSSSDSNSWIINLNKRIIFPRSSFYFHIYLVNKRLFSLSWAKIRCNILLIHMVTGFYELISFI